MLLLIAAAIAAVACVIGCGAANRISRRPSIAHGRNAAESYHEIESQARELGTGLGIGA